jgi:hypothetical protein
MKTTLDLNADLLMDAKRQAAASGATLKAFVEEALRARLLEFPKAAKQFRLDLPVVQGDRPPAVDVADRSALYDFLETNP